MASKRTVEDEKQSDTEEKSGAEFTITHVEKKTDDSSTKHDSSSDDSSTYGSTYGFDDDFSDYDDEDYSEDLMKAALAEAIRNNETDLSKFKIVFD